MHASRRWRRKEGEIKAESAVLRPAAFASCEPREALCHGPRESWGNDSQERRVDTPHVVRCVVAGTCGYTCRPLTSRASLTSGTFSFGPPEISRDLPRSSCRSRPVRGRSPPTSQCTSRGHSSVEHLHRRDGRATADPSRDWDSPEISAPRDTPGHPRHVVLLLDQKAYLNSHSSNLRVGDLFSVLGRARSPGPLRSDTCHAHAVPNFTV
jgi:hypothetical protein